MRVLVFSPGSSTGTCSHAFFGAPPDSSRASRFAAARSRVSQASSCGAMR